MSKIINEHLLFTMNGRQKTEQIVQCTT